LAEPGQIIFTSPALGEVQLWFMRLPQLSLAINEGSVTQLLDTEELRRWRRFVFYKDAQRFLAGRAFLRIVLGAVLGMPPRELAFSTGTFGKPTLATAGTDRVRFSLSRTSHMIALALTAGVDVGVDVEHVARASHLDRLAEIFCDNRELHAMAAMPMVRRIDRLIQTWTLKEAFLKAVGVGMSMQLDRFGFDFFAAARPQIHFADPSHGSPSDWYFASLNPTVGSWASIAVRLAGEAIPILGARYCGIAATRTGFELIAAPLTDAGK
jgi:4'-phosphopantetheinyl transferase